jgi:hypothetical protein
MTDLVGLISTTVTMAKGALEISKKMNEAVSNKAISDLYIQLAQIQTTAAEKEVEILDLKNEIQTLKAEMEEQKTNPLDYNGLVYIGNDKFPYCTACYDERRKRIHLKVILYEKTHTHLFRCPVCHAEFIENATL